MEAQDYLKESIKEAGIFLEATTKYRETFDSLFKEAKNETDVYSLISTFDDERMNQYFESSQIIVDSQLIFQKIASFVYFTKILGIELDLSELSTVNGLLEFVTNYRPFDTDYVVTPEGDLKEKNKKDSDLKFNEFRNAINITKTMLNEGRD